MRFDGTTLATVDSLQSNANLKVFDKPKIIIAGDSRLFGADCMNQSDGTGTRVPYRLFWSDLLDGTRYKGGVGGGSSGFVDLAKDSDPITGLYYANSSLLVFKPNSIHLGYAAGPPKFYDFREIVSGVGCVSHSTIKLYREGIVLWLGDDNIYAGGVNRQPQAIGDRIRPRLREVILLSSIEKARAVVDRQNHLYHLFLPDSGATYNNKVIRIFTVNLKNGSWWEGSYNQSGIDITDGLEFRDAPWSTQQLLASADGRIFNFSFNNTADLGTAFSTSWTSGVMMVKSFAKDTDQASFQMLRITSPDGSPARSMQLLASIGKGLDRFETTSFGNQTIDGSSDIYVSNRPKSGETFKLQLASADSTTVPRIAALGVGAINQGLNVKK